MANNYTIDYNDQRFTEVESQKQEALNNMNNTYNNMINNSDQYYSDMINAAEDYGIKQQEIQQANTDFAIEKIEQQKANAKKDYEKEQRGSYVDYAREVNPYGQSAESAATSGIGRGSGVSESARIQAWSAYQGRIGQARDTYNRAITEYDMGIKDAQLQNNAKLAEIAYQSLSKKLELGLNQFQYKNTLLGQQLEMQRTISNDYYTRWQNVLSQMNTENSLAEQIRQYNQDFAEKQRQYNATLAENQRQFNEELELQKKKLSSISGSGGSSKSSSKSSKSGSSSKNYTVSGNNSKNSSSSSNVGNTVKQGANNIIDALTKEKQGPKQGLKDEPILKGNKVLKGSAYTYYEKNYKNKKFTESQLKTKLNQDLKNNKLNRAQVDLILQSYGYKTTGSTLNAAAGNTKKNTRTFGISNTSLNSSKNLYDFTTLNIK